MSSPPRSVLGEPPERFVPEEMGGTLLAAEHLVRYWWAAQAVRGADVLDAACGVGFGTQLLAEAGARSAIGVDISEEAVAAARTRCGERAALAIADVEALPLPSDSVDLAVCFETIEHVAHPERAIAELRRVLRGSGTLVISSPNRGVSTPGNPHHVREFTPAELEAELQRAFAHVELLGQQSWFASALVSAEDRRGDPARELEVAVRTDEAMGPGEETYVVALAADGPLPPELSRGAAFFASQRGPSALHEQVRVGQRQVHLEAARAARAQAESGELARDLELARDALRAIQSSPSWRLTAPLRSAKRLLSARR